MRSASVAELRGQRRRPQTESRSQSIRLSCRSAGSWSVCSAFRSSQLVKYSLELFLHEDMNLTSEPVCCFDIFDMFVSHLYFSMVVLPPWLSCNHLSAVLCLSHSTSALWDMSKVYRQTVSVLAHVDVHMSVLHG